MISPLTFDSIISASNLAEIRRIELRSRRSVDSNLAGQYRSAFRGSGLVFNDIREYMPGDDVKHIHWKVTARSGKVYIKSYEEDRELNIVIALDISSSTTAGSVKSKYRRGLEFCGIVSMLAKMSQDSLGLCMFSDKIEKYLPVSKSRTQIKRILLELLEERRHTPSTNLAEALTYLSQNLKRNSVVFVISDFFSPHYLDELRLLSMKHDVIAVMLEDQLDYNLPDAGLVEFQDAESGEYMLLDTSNKKVREKLAAHHEKRLADWRETCRKAGCDFIEIKEKPLWALSRLMQRRNKRLR
jgi:uncharacterized protein (DUF58 family)